MLTAGASAPLDIPITDSQGKSVTLRQMLGRLVVVYFYPKDDTPGCTLEACSIRDWMGELKKTGVEVIGVSKDSPESHQTFIASRDLNFRLWSDSDHLLMESFGVWGERRFMGKTFMGTSRSTFLLNPIGIIIHVWEKVTPRDHGREIYDVVKNIVHNK